MSVNMQVHLPPDGRYRNTGDDDINDSAEWSAGNA